jgi:hypothetical protein
MGCLTGKVTPETQLDLKFDLSAEDIKELEDGFASIQVQGARAPQALLKSHDIGANLGSISTGGHGLSPLPQKLAK